MQDDLTNRIVATVADSAGVLVRSMAASIRDRACGGVVARRARRSAISPTSRPFEPTNTRLSERRFERALETQPSHALAWACLASLYEHEHSLELNPLPDAAIAGADGSRALGRTRPHVSAGCGAQIAMRCHFDRDLNGLRMAAERTIQLNPLSTAAAYMGSLLGYCRRLGSRDVV